LPLPAGVERGIFIFFLFNPLFLLDDPQVFPYRRLLLLNLSIQ